MMNKAAIERRFMEVARRRLAGDLRLELLETIMSYPFDIEDGRNGHSLKTQLSMLTMQYLLGPSASMPPSNFSKLDDQFTKLIDDWAKQQEPDVPVQSVEPTKIMSRRGLIEAHETDWPTIATDIQHASENGLRDAKAGARGWDESKALTWAKSKGKIKSAQKYTVRLNRVM